MLTLNLQLEYYSELNQDFKLSILDINTEINLDDLLKSSPLAIKQSIHHEHRFVQFLAHNLRKKIA